MKNAQNKIVSDIVQKKLCLGCGLCQSVIGKEKVDMKIQSTGFIQPVFKDNISKKEQNLILKICPGLNVVKEGKSLKPEERIWGEINSISSTFSTDPAVRFNGSSGGTISEIAIFLLESGEIEGVLQVGSNSKDFTKNTLRVSRSKEEILECASSRYAPASIFDSLIETLDQSMDKFCFIGKPCDISALKNFICEYPQYNGRIQYTLSIVCAGMPSFNATQAAINSFDAASPVSNLRYRGGGWPGYFSFKDATGKEHSMSYNDSWGKILGRQVHDRCKICPDGIGLQADIAVGDAWETKDGYPDFTEKEGQSLTIARTIEGEQLINNMTNSGRLTSSPLPVEKLQFIQPFQYNRRQMVWIRTLAFTIARLKKLNFKNLSTAQNAARVPLYHSIREFAGSLKRFNKRAK